MPMVFVDACYCSNCVYQDITANVTNQDGSVDNDVLDNWCANHPAPG
jgi:hypothetical protein